MYSLWVRYPPAPPGTMLAMRPLLIFANDRKVFGHPCKMLRVFIVANIVSGGAGGCLARRYDAWGTFCDVSDRKVFWVTAGSEFPPRNVWFHFVTFLHISFGKICRLVTKNQRNRNEYFDERAARRRHAGVCGHLAALPVV